MNSRSTIFVDTKWLAGRLGTPGLAIVDGSFFIPGQGRDAEQEYNLAHIPGAVRFDVDAICDHSNPLPHMLPSAEEFAAAVGALGISEHDTIVVYDVLGLFSAPRVWWTFRLFGAEKVVILDGGLPKWQAEGRPVETGPAKPMPKRFAAKPPRDLVATAASVAQAAANGTAQVVDARRAAVPRRRSGAAAGPLVRAHSGLRATYPSRRWSPTASLLPDEQLKSVDDGRWRRSRSTGHHQLRLGRVGGGGVARPRSARKAAGRPL